MLLSLQHHHCHLREECQAPPPGPTDKPAHPDDLLQGMSQMPLRSLTSPRAAHEIFSAGYLASRSSLQQRCLWVGPADLPLT